MNENGFSSKKAPYVHICKLPKSSMKHIGEGNVSWFKEQFIKFCFISPNVSIRKNYTKSRKIIEKERLDQWLNHFWIIHPFSDFIYYVEIIMIVVYFLRLAAVPYFVILHITEIRYTIAKLLLKILTCMYIGIQFFTGYYRSDVKEVVLEQKQIVWRYLRTYFIPDLLGNLPVFELLYVSGYEESKVNIYKCFVIFNIFSLLRCTESFQQKRDLNFILFKIFYICLLFGISFTWLIALTHLAVNIETSNGLTNHYVSNWWFAFQVFSMVFGFGVENHFTNSSVIILNVVSLSFGFILRSIILVMLVLWGQTYCFNKNKKHTLTKAIHEFCYYHKIPTDLRNKILQYYDYKFPNIYFNEANIYELLSESIKHNIKNYECEQWCESDIFRSCSVTLKQLIVINIEKEIFVKNDVIYSIGDNYDKVYFTKYGAVLKYNINGEMVTKIEEGNFFSKRGFLRHFFDEHKLKAVAAENCTVLSLTSNTFERIMNKYPNEYINILKILETTDPHLSQSINHYYRLSQIEQLKLRRKFRSL